MNIGGGRKIFEGGGGSLPPAALAVPAAVVPGGAASHRRHWLSLPLQCRRGDEPPAALAIPAFSLPSCPLSPQPPSPAGKGETKVIFMQGASPLASPGLNPGGTCSSCRCGAGGAASPRRHWLSLPRGRGPSQTPKFLSPGPPSPWLPALLKGKPFCRFYTIPQAPRCAGYLLGRDYKCRRRFSAGVPGAVAPGEINFGTPPSRREGGRGDGGKKES